MKTYIALFLFLISFNTISAQKTMEEKKAERRQRSNWRLQEEKNNATKLSDEQVEELETIANKAKQIIMFTESDMTTFSNAEEFFNSANKNALIEITTLYQKYISEGKKSTYLNTVSYIADKQSPEFIKTKAAYYLNNKLKTIKDNTANAKGPYSNDSQKDAALKKWKALHFYTEFFTQVVPDNQDLKVINDKVVAEISHYESQFSEKFAAYVKTEMHKKYREKVVLSYKPIVYSKENEASFLDNVTIDENNAGLYFMYYNNVPNIDYLKDQLGNKRESIYAQLQFGNDVDTRMFNGCLIEYEKAYDLSNAEEKQAYLSLPVFPSPSNYKRDKWLDQTYYRYLQCLVEMELNTPHNARIVFGFPGSEKKFDKKFTLTITDEGHKKLMEVMGKIEYEKLKEVRMGKQGSQHNSVNINIVKAAAQKEGYDIKRVVITGNSYKVYKNSNYPYEIRNKACNAELAYQENGKCYVREFQIIKEYQGGGTYGKPVVAFKWGTKQGILCDNIPK